MGSITRDVYENRGPNGIDVRLYTDNESGVDLPSVTTILKTREEDLSALHDWQDRNDGKDDNAFHKHLFWYKRHRGTLAHWHALRTLDPDLEWSEDEESSLWKLNNVDQLNDEDENPEVHDATPREVLYSVRKDQHAVESWGEFYDEYGPYKNHDHYSDGLNDQKDRDVSFFVQTFERLCDTLGLTQEHVIAVEQFMFDLEYEYAGQVDLIYECPITGETVVADLKTKKSAYDKEKLQGAAYADAAERDDDLPIDSVDRTEVWCIHPDSGKHAIYSGDGSVSGLHTSKYWNTSYEDLVEQFRELAAAFEYEERDG